MSPPITLSQRPGLRGSDNEATHDVSRSRAGLPAGDARRGSRGRRREDYLEKALRDYKPGARKNAIMAGFAAGLTQQDIKNIAAHYSSQPAVLFTRY
jgi:hypothetical protein